jgi:hypothetical protein
LGRNDIYGYALAAQPDKSQGRPTTNTGSEPSEQERPAHTCFPKAPIPDGRTVRPPSSAAGRSKTARGPPPHFIPGTNAIESINYQLRKVTKTRGHFPDKDSAMKLLYLAIRNINQKRGTQGTGTHRWTEAFNSFAIQFPDRLPL